MQTQTTQTSKMCDVTTTKVTPTLYYANISFNHFIGGKASHDTSDASFSFLAALSVCRVFEGRTCKSCILVLPQHGKEKVFL